MSNDTAPTVRTIKAPARKPTSDRYHNVCTALELAHSRGKTDETSVLDFIATRRAVTDEQPSPVPFRLIARELGDITGVDVTHEAVRRWFRATEAELAELAQADAA